MSNTVLVVAAHSDDEALGCAGTITKHIMTGDKVHLLFMTDGVAARLGNEGKVAERQIVSREVAEVFQATSITNLNFPDNKMDTVPLLDVTKEVEKVVGEVCPNIIYTHHIGDVNIDHQITHKAVMTACRPQPCFCVKEIYAFEVLSSTEWQVPNVLPFMPNVFIDITEQIEIKRKVLELYSAEMRKAPHSRSIENVIDLARVRGSSVGVKYAEAFISLRELR